MDQLVEQDGKLRYVFEDGRGAVGFSNREDFASWLFDKYGAKCTNRAGSEGIRVWVKVRPPKQVHMGTPKWNDDIWDKWRAQVHAAAFALADDSPELIERKREVERFFLETSRHLEMWELLGEGVEDMIDALGEDHPGCRKVMKALDVIVPKEKQ